LSCAKLTAAFGVTLPGWEASMRLCLAEIRTAGGATDKS
jgi:hypothetical protein